MVLSACQAPKGEQPSKATCELPSTLGDVGVESKIPAAFSQKGDAVKLTVSSGRAGSAGALAVSLRAKAAVLAGSHAIDDDVTATLLSKPLGDGGDVTRYFATKGVVRVEAGDGDQMTVTLKDATFATADGACQTKVESARFDVSRKGQRPSVAAKP